MKTRFRFSALFVLLCALCAVCVLAFTAAADSEGTATEYGVIPEESESAPFALFTDGNFLSAQQTWAKSINAARTYLASNPGETVTVLMRQDHSNTSATDPLGRITGNLVIDLGGHSLVRGGGQSIMEAGTKNATEEECAVAANITVRNGRILAMNKEGGNTGHIMTYQSFVNFDKEINVTFDNVTFAISADAYDSGLYSLITRSWGASGGATGVITSDLTFRNCTYDFSGSEGTRTFASTRLVSTSGGKASQNIAITVEGGEFLGSSSGVTLFDIDNTDSVTYTKNSEGKYTSYVLNAGNPPTAAVSTDAGSAYFGIAGTRDGYAVYEPCFAPVETAYGEIPTDALRFGIVLFGDGKYLGGFDSWKSASGLIKSTLTDDPGGEVTVLFRRNMTTDAVNGSERLSYMNGTVTLDLGGNILVTNGTLIECGVAAANYTEAFDTTVNVKNGEIRMGTYFFAAECRASVDKKMTLNFEGVTFGVDEATYNTSRNKFFFSWPDNSSTQSVDTLSFFFRDCTFDLRGRSNDFILFSFSGTQAGVAADFHISGGRFLADSFANVTLITADENDSLTFEKNTDGKYPVVTVPADHELKTVSGVNEDGKLCYFADPVTDGGYKTYSLVKVPEVVKTAYGDIPEENTTAVYAIFSEGSFLAGKDTWKDANNYVRSYLSAHAGAEVQILLRSNDTTTSSLTSGDRVPFMNGSVVFDLDGKTLLAAAAILECGVPAAYTGDFTSDFTIKNGTLLLGKGNILVAECRSDSSKVMNVTFDHVTIGIDPETHATNRNRLFFAYNDQTYAGKDILNITLNECKIDLRDLSIAFTVFSFKNTPAGIEANIRMIGGEILAKSLDNVTLTNFDENDSLTFAKGENGYTALTVESGKAFSGDYAADGGKTVYFVGTKLTELDFTDWSVVTPAGCTEAGLKTRYDKNNPARTESREIPAEGHTLGEWIEEIPATVEAEGVLGHYTCSVCKKNFDAEKNELASLVIPQLPPPVGIDGVKQNLTLATDFRTNLFFPKSEEKKLLSVKYGDVTLPLVRRWLDGVEYDCVSVAFGADEAAKEIVLTYVFLYEGEEHSNKVTTDLVRYCEKLKALEDGRYADLAGAILYYASKATPDAGITAERVILNAPAPVNTISSESPVTGASFYLGSAPVMLFTLDKNYTGELRLSWNGNAVVKAVGENAQVALEELKLYDLIETVKVEYRNASGEFVEAGRYNLSAYARYAGNNESPAVAKLADALCDYAVAAHKYAYGE